MTRDRYLSTPDPRDRDEDAMLRAHHDRLEASAHPRPEFVDGLEQQLLAPPLASRFRFRPAIAAVLLFGALVGGAIAGGIFQARDLANDPEPTPQPTLSQASPDPSASSSHTVVIAATATASPTASPTSSPSPSQAPTVTPSPTIGPTATPSPTPVLAWRELTGEISVDRGIADSVLGDDGLLYTFLWGHGHVAPVLVVDPADNSAELRHLPTTEWVQVDAQLVVGPDGIIYMFGWGPDLSDVVTFDPSTEAFASKPNVPVTVWDATRGTDGTIYLIGTSAGRLGAQLTEVHVYDPRTGTASLIASSEDLGDGRALKSTTDGRLIVFGSGGVASLDPQTLAWNQIAPAPTADAYDRVVEIADGDRLIVSMGLDRNVRYFDGDRWHTVGAPAGVASITRVGGRWIAITLSPHLGHPSSAQYWEVTPVD